MKAISAGAEWQDGHLLLPRGVTTAERARWLAVVDTPEGGSAWVLTRTRGAVISHDVYGDLARGKLLEDGRIAVASGTFALVPPSPFAPEQVAILAPA